MSVFHLDINNQTYLVGCPACGRQAELHEETLALTGLVCPGCGGSLDGAFAETLERKINEGPPLRGMRQ